MRNFAFIIFALIALMNCIDRTKTYDPKEGEKIIDFDPKSQDNMSLQAKAGDLFTLKIRGNPTTGYGWYLDNAINLNRQIVKPLNLNKYNGSSEYISDPHPPGWVGGGGSYYFQFQAIGEGKVDLIFVNKRIWDPSGAQFYTFDVTVN